MSLGNIQSARDDQTAIWWLATTLRHRSSDIASCKPFIATFEAINISNLDSFHKNAYYIGCFLEEIFQCCLLSRRMLSKLASFQNNAFNIGCFPEEGFQCWLLSRRRLSKKVSMLASFQKDSFKVGFLLEECFQRWFLSRRMLSKLAFRFLILNTQSLSVLT